MNRAGRGAGIGRRRGARRIGRIRNAGRKETQVIAGAKVRIRIGDLQTRQK